MKHPRGLFHSRSLSRSRLPIRMAAALIGAALLASPSGAQTQNTHAQTVLAIDTTVRSWMQEHQIGAASLAVMKDNALIGSYSYGGMSAAKPARIASLSKAITAVCIARLIDEGRLSFTAPVGAVLAGTFKRVGEPIDPRFRAITIEQLVTHRAGLAREARPGPPARDINGMLAKIVLTPLADNPGTRMSYSNVGYQILGAVVEGVSGSPYERRCGSTVLAPMKASGVIDPELRPRAASGGWRVSAIDYAKFIQVFDAKSGVLGDTSRSWQEARPGNPAYGLGTFLRRSAQGVTFWHTGRVGLRERGGSLTIKSGSGWTAVVIFEGDGRGGTPELRRQLDALLSTH
jgi:CubicO group peptidase (beta-lactamase class C family)